jgi:hypothetical protein
MVTSMEGQPSTSVVERKDALRGVEEEEIGRFECSA